MGDSRSIPAGGCDRLGPIVQYWHASTPPDYIETLLETFSTLNPGLRHLVFDEAAADCLISEHCEDREAAAFRACAVPAMQADYFRYCAMLVLGGVSCDADLRCTGGLRELIPAPGAARLFLRPHGVVVNGLSSFGSPGHPLLTLTLEVATANIERRSWDSVYMTTGPAVWTYLYWMHQAGSFDAMIKKAAGLGLTEDARSYCENVGDFERVERAFEGVTVSPSTDGTPFISASGMHFPYKETDVHWTNVKGSIYRNQSARQ